MKSENLIRQYRASLQLLSDPQQNPCQCQGTQHEEECRFGGMLMTAVAETLAWVLDGENPSTPKVVDEINRRAAQLRRSQR